MKGVASFVRRQISTRTFTIESVDSFNNSSLSHANVFPLHHPLAKVTHWQLETASRDVATMVTHSVQWRLAEGVNGQMNRSRLEAAARTREVTGK